MDVSITSFGRAEQVELTGPIRLPRARAPSAGRMHYALPTHGGNPVNREIGNRATSEPAR
jgi:hypothetical protein